MKKEPTPPKPLILAPAGSKSAFLAALAAKADAVYCGLKHFSARMTANNFSIDELARLTALAHDMGAKVYVTLNSLVKPDEPDLAGKLLDQLTRYVKPDACIIQDLGFVPLARQAGYKGELHLSTLANLSFPSALKTIKKEGISCVVIPRELHIDEIKAMTGACPDDLELEVFVHGALCYSVSGRCYWSSHLGGKSSLRGQCVQPCRRVYGSKGQKQRFFSCQDLSLDVLAKVLLSEKKIRAWKIEGRKKGPHYVYHTVKAYRLFRDHGTDPAMKKEAVALLENALGRQGTHFHFLPQRPQVPIATSAQTGSGLLMGTVRGPRKQQYLVPRDTLLKGDILRLGYEDEPGHAVYRVTKSVPKKGRLVFKLPPKNTPRKDTPVFLLDRREQEMMDQLAALDETLKKIPQKSITPSHFHPKPPKKTNFSSGKNRNRTTDLLVSRSLEKGLQGNTRGLWITKKNLAALPKKGISETWWVLPPVIWPDEETAFSALIEEVLKKEGKYFILNAPWQVSFFKKTTGIKLWAGPFCNAANAFAVQILAARGFSGVIVSPELSRNDYLLLAEESPLPLGIVLSGNWPIAISRTKAENIKTNTPFTSPKGELAWISRYDANYWVYPNWTLDIRPHKKTLVQAGYRLFLHLKEPKPGSVSMRKRPGLWNWNLNLL